MENVPLSLSLVPSYFIGLLQPETVPAPIADALWYTAIAEGDGLAYTFPVGTLVGMNYLTADMLIDGNHLVVFLLSLQEGEGGPRFGLLFSGLNQCSFRLRMPLEAVNQNRWRYPREGAWLKPMCWGDRVALERVDRLTLTVLRKSSRPARFCITPLMATVEEPARLTGLVLPAGPLLDELGQSTLHEWPTKSRSVEEVSTRLHKQLQAAPEHRWPQGWSRWGGWTEKRFTASGFFRIHHDGARWWLVDPDGYAFWSAGINCVRVDTDAAYSGLEQALSWLPDPDGPFAAIYQQGAEGPTVNYLAANLIRAFGPDKWYENWAAIALGELRRLGFNTVANWSDWHIAQKAGFPYVRPLHPEFRHTPMIFRDFPDVFDERFAHDAALFAEQLRPTADDPAMIGYFLMNEPTWGFAAETPAAGMLFNTSGCAARVALSDWLRQKYGDDNALSAAWEMNVTLEAVKEGVWHTPLTATSQADLAAFSEIMVEMLFKGLSDACRRVDPHHLNLGARYYTVPPWWVIKGMRHFDLFSMNCYQERVPAGQTQEIAQLLNMPIIIGEWHFGALDVGLPGSGIGHVRDQAARGQAFRVYVENAAALPWCVGVHYFTLYDESALGRFDGENWNIGFLDVCNRPYEPLAQAARLTHEQLYRIAAGEIAPYNEAPEYLPRLFL
mgnify:FL=1